MTPNDPLPSSGATESRAHVVIAVVVCVLAVALVAVALRVYVRLALVARFGIDDALAVLAFLVVAACGSTMIWNTRYGLGQHIQSLDGPTVMLYMRTFYFSIVFYNTALLVIKMTFLTQYYRVMGVRQAGTSRLYLGVMIVVGSWSLSQILVAVFFCRPVSGFWDHSLPGVYCIPNLPQWYANAVGNIISDFVVLVLPLPAIIKLKLHQKQKIVLMGIFCLGFFTVAISFIRISFLKQTDDFTWDNVGGSCWSIVELSSGLTCACLPTLRPLVPALAHGWSAASGDVSGGRYPHRTANKYKHGGPLSSSGPVIEGQTDRSGHLESEGRGPPPSESKEMLFVGVEAFEMEANPSPRPSLTTRE